jgi:hypothetical protein
VALRIGFDLDGVLADMDGELVRQATRLFGGAPSPVEPDTAEASPGATADPRPALPQVGNVRLSPRQERRLWRHVESIENFWETLPEIEPAIVERLAAIAAARRWEIIFLTRRPPTAGATPQVQSQRWLEAKGFRLPSVFVVQGSRGHIAAALDLDVVVDDRTENCLDVVVDSKARAILVWREDEKQVPAAGRRLGIGVVNSVSACLDVLVQIDTPADDDPGVMGRVRRFLGLKEPALNQQ